MEHEENHLVYPDHCRHLNGLDHVMAVQPFFYPVCPVSGNFRGVKAIH
jgi:hypothetical protein